MVSYDDHLQMKIRKALGKDEDEGDEAALLSQPTSADAIMSLMHGADDDDDADRPPGV